jgi:hypothetical protein
VDISGDAEVGEIGVPFGVEQDVAGLHIAVDDPVAVSVVQRSADLVDQLEHVIERQRALLGPSVE